MRRKQDIIENSGNEEISERLYETEDEDRSERLEKMERIRRKGRDWRKIELGEKQEIVEKRENEDRSKRLEKIERMRKEARDYRNEIMRRGGRKWRE